MRSITALIRANHGGTPPQSPPKSPEGLRSLLLSGYGRVLMTVLGLRQWRSHEELVALAQHLEHEVFPALRDQGIPSLDITVPSDAVRSLTCTGNALETTFLGTERLAGRLREQGVRTVRLSATLESGQVVESLLLLLFSASRRHRPLPMEHGYTGWHPDRIAAAMQSPQGYLKFCARMTFEPDSGLFESSYTYCELGVTRALARYVRRNRRFGDHRVLFHEAPRFALLLALVLTIPLVLYFAAPTLFVPVYLSVMALIGIAGATAVYTLGAYEYGREHHDLLIKSHVDQVRQLNRDMANQNDVLERTNGLKDLLLKAGAHDIRNPLLQIMLRAETHLMRAERDNDTEQIGAWQQVLTNTERIRGIVDNFLNLQRIQEGKLCTNCQPIELQSIVASVVASRHAELAHRQLDVVVESDANGGVAWGDHTCVKEALQNYIGNAIKFSPTGSRITVNLSAHEKQQRVTVRDEGPGVPRGERTQLFQAFAQLSNRPQNGESSTGLGLAVTRQLMEAQGGQVGADFPAEGGSAFWFELPRRMVGDGSTVRLAEQGTLRA